MKAVLFSFTRRGAALSLKLQSYLEAMHWQTTVYGGKNLSIWIRSFRKYRPVCVK